MKIVPIVSILALALAMPTSSFALSKGVNMAWMQNDPTGSNYGHDIGANYSSSAWSTWVSRCHNDGSSWIRIWLHEGKEGLVLDGSGNPTNITSTFRNNLINLKGFAGTVEWTIFTGVPEWLGNATSRQAMANVAKIDKGVGLGGYFDICNEVNYSTSSQSNANDLKSRSGMPYSCDGNGWTSAGMWHAYSDGGYSVPKGPTSLSEFGPRSTGNVPTQWNNAINGFWSSCVSNGYSRIAAWKEQNTDGHYMYQGSWVSTWKSK